MVTGIGIVLLSLVLVSFRGFARLGGGILSLGLVLLFTNSVYRSEMRRFNRNIRDDLTRVKADNRLVNRIGNYGMDELFWTNFGLFICRLCLKLLCFKLTKY